MIFNSSHREKDSLFVKVADKVVETLGTDIILTDDRGEYVAPKVTTASEASIEKVKMWLLSDTNDYIRKPEFGTGIQHEMYNKPLTDEVATKMETKIKKLAEVQVPEYVLTEIKFTPDVNKRTWKVFFKGYDNSKDVPFQKEQLINFKKSES